MKKFIALFLVLILAFSLVLVSCNKTGDDGEPTDGEGEGDDFIGIGVGGSTTAYTGGTTSKFQSGNTHTDFEWTNDTAGTMVYVWLNNVSVRSDTSTDSTTFKDKAYFGESYKRIRYNEVWTQIEFKGNQYYIWTDYVSTDDGYITFTDDASETKVYVSEDFLNLRFTTYIPNEDDGFNNLAKCVERGDELTRVATSKNGKWIKVKCAEAEGGFAYCNASCVASTPEAASTTGGSAVTSPDVG